MLLRALQDQLQHLASRIERLESIPVVYAVHHVFNDSGDLCVKALTNTLVTPIICQELKIDPCVFQHTPENADLGLGHGSYVFFDCVIRHIQCDSILLVYRNTRPLHSIYNKLQNHFTQKIILDGIWPPDIISDFLKNINTNFSKAKYIVLTSTFASSFQIDHSYPNISIIYEHHKIAFPSPMYGHFFDQFTIKQQNGQSRRANQEINASYRFSRGACESSNYL